MAITIELPHVGESVVEGTIGRWLKQPGDTVERYEPLVEVITDKVTMEVPSPVGGSLLRILAQEGETIPMGTAIAEIETTESPAPAEPDLASPPASAAPTPATQTAPSTRPAGTTGYLVKDIKQIGPTGGGAGEQSEGATPTEAPIPATTQPGSPSRLSPAVRRLVKEHGVDLSQIAGTGLGGRITRNDVLHHLEQPASPEASAPAITPPSPSPSPSAAVQSQSAPSPQITPGGDEEHLPLTPVRRMIAEAMARSASQIPHAWSVIEVDVNGLVAKRTKIRASFEEQEGVDLTYLPFIIQAVTAALREHPTLNASWGGDKIVLKKRINLGVAMAAPQGLVVPVIHDADWLSLSGLAHALSDLTRSARQNRLSLPDVQGGTFTLNNTGALGSVVSQPIINYPQAAILTTEAIQKRLAVLPGDAIAIRSMMNLCLSFDHRINDGAESSAFLQSVKRNLETISPDTPVR